MEKPITITCGKCDHRNISPFSACSDEAINRILANKEINTFRAGNIILKEGNKFSGLYCILKGTARVSKSTNDSRELILWIEGPGDMVGFDSYCNENGSLFTVSAITDVTACFIPAPDVQRMMYEEPAFAIPLMQWLCNKIDTLEERVVSSACKTIREQFAEVMIMLKRKARKNGEGWDYTIKDIADVLGTSQNYLYKVIHDLSRKNIVSLENHYLRIKDENKLALMANGEY